ncbi:uncharacterized protein TRIADDRAFT_52631 [Trichoplax adhaerens]|uniref:IST1 homolog n=1 Tax=Trichoplax adhaerens TaxID=10228 RepID=B3RJH8_TRIAD|nr:hypothetical protein TRIADDRAFT_52631 [Trichoplax adhaerens]EDV29822.1 hypothetical protein TRIADDRAFT_52631 [Trichoplax adhaerens]|eukprot:XP_002109024.1 hypothetical protein TRIADDRAFT_52631 [Trichoplax adhaerens]
MAQKSRKEIADYLINAKYERARIRVEHIIREDYLVEAMELVELYCDLLLARFGLLESMKHCDEGLLTAVCSLIWASPRLASDVAELRVVSELLGIKFGKKFAEDARANADSYVNEHLIQRLSPHGPPAVLVEQYIVEIARSHNVAYEPDPAVLAGAGIPTVDDLMSKLPSTNEDNDHKPNGGGGGGGGHALPPQMNTPVMPQPPVLQPQAHQAQYPSQPPYPTHQNDMVYPPAGTNNAPGFFPGPANYNNVAAPADRPPSYEDPRKHASKDLLNSSILYTALPNVPMHPENNNMPDLPSVPNGSLPTAPSTKPGNSNVGQNSAGGDDVDFDDLTRRFEELKKKK